MAGVGGGELADAHEGGLQRVLPPEALALRPKRPAGERVREAEHTLQCVGVARPIEAHQTEAALAAASRLKQFAEALERAHTTGAPLSQLYRKRIVLMPRTRRGGRDWRMREWRTPQKILE